MNQSENDSYLYLEGYDYEPTSEMDLSPDLPDGARLMTVLCCVISVLGLLGVFNKVWIFKEKEKHVLLSQFILWH